MGKELVTIRRPRLSLWHVIRRVIARSGQVGVMDLSASMTFYTLLSLLPGMIVVISVVSLIGQAESTVDVAVDLMDQIYPALNTDTVRDVLLGFGRVGGGPLAITIGIVGALWTASGYASAFRRALHRIYQTREGHRIWTSRLYSTLLTAVGIVAVVVFALFMVFSGDFSERIGSALGIEEGTVRAWNMARWPIVTVVITVMVGLMFNLAPNVDQARFRLITPGAVLSVLVWLGGSTLFIEYASLGTRYSRLYGTLAGVIVMVTWLWLTNMALLLGALLDAELLRARQMALGIEASDQIQLEPRARGAIENAQATTAEFRALAGIVTDAVHSGESVTVRRTRDLVEHSSPWAVHGPKMRARAPEPDRSSPSSAQTDAASVPRERSARGRALAAALSTDDVLKNPGRARGPSLAPWRRR